MGESTFKEYLLQTDSFLLEKELTEALTIFHKHEMALNERVKSIDPNASDNEKITGIISEFFEKIKAQFANDDRTLLDYAIQGIDMGLKAVQDFKIKHAPVDELVLNAINDMEEDYKFIYQRLVDLRLDQ